ncbi:MAG TPA: hypothetical protein VHD87_15165 [Acidimicrobiales bacterium]|nr:hypothetical protein [Acidimicrobiales bacterium]
MNPRWETIDVGELIAAYNLSAPTARVWVTAEGEGRASGGDKDLLDVIRRRRDEVVEYLTAPCACCGEEIATRLAWMPDGHIRIGEVCWVAAVAAEMATPGAAPALLDKIRAGVAVAA